MYDYSILPNRIILCVDLRSFYASVSCIKMGLDPMHTKLVVVGDVNRSGSILLAATPPLKALGVKKMARLYEIPRRKDILVVNPIMSTYIKCSNYITKLALKFKREIYEHTRIECTIGIAPNPLMSKVALDIEAKKNKEGIAHWKYEDVPTKLWSIRPLNNFWGISYKTEEKLNRKGIHSIGDLANYPLKYLKQSFGKIGEELHLHSNGIDFSRISEKYVPATTSIGKSQILMRDYTIEEFPIVLLEHIEEICYRLRRQNKLAQTVQFSVGYSKSYTGGIRKTHTLSRPTNLTMDIYKICTYFLHQQYTGEPIRSINISLTNLIREGEEQISLFDNVTQREQEVKLTKVMDEIRTRFGKNSILRGISYTHSATARHRNTLIGGHKS
ncbi:DinB/UmuC family translesion DNA polymerase [Bacillus cereus]|uniref:DinB/UmuC family translesion DNA polymerase n=1 Tax=Bacillus cereus TaxID=1396 RepID=UPI003980D57F